MFGKPSKGKTFSVEKSIFLAAAAGRNSFSTGKTFFVDFFLPAAPGKNNSFTDNNFSRVFSSGGCAGKTFH